MDLVEEEDRRAAARATALAGPLDHGPNLRPPGVDGRHLLEGALGLGGRDPRQRRLATARRAIEDRAVGLARADRGPQSRALGEKVLLADQLLEAARAHPNGQGGVLGRNVTAAPGLLLG